MDDVEGLRGRTAVVTGGSSGLGRATAMALAAAGADVAVLARGSRDLEETAEQIRAAGGNAVAVVVDLADADQVTSAIAQVRRELGDVDVLVNAAGTDVPGAVADLDVAAWDRVLAVNLRASFLLARAVWPGMCGRGGGTIVNVSSIAGRRGWANASAYCAAKFGLTGFTQALAAEGKPHRIRACVLYSGAMDTSWGVWSSEERGTASPTVPSDALPPQQVADLILWIASAPPDMVLNEVTVTPWESRDGREGRPDACAALSRGRLEPGGTTMSSSPWLAVRRAASALTAGLLLITLTGCSDPDGGGGGGGGGGGYVIGSTAAIR